MGLAAAINVLEVWKLLKAICSSWGRLLEPCLLTSTVSLRGARITSSRRYCTSEPRMISIRLISPCRQWTISSSSMVTAIVASLSAFCSRTFTSKKKRNKQTKELFGDMVEARDAKFKRLLIAKGCPIDEKKRRYGTKHVRCHVLTLPEICSIAVGDDHINVLCSRPNTKLWIEASSKCFDALATRLRVTIENAANPDGQIAPDVQHDNLINAGA